MKSQKFKRIIVLLLVTAMAVAIPGSFAKYVGRQNYKMSVKLVRSFIFNTSETKKSQIVELPYAGRYAIIVKGGDGAFGATWKNENNKSYSVFDINGGVGGTVVGVYTTTQDHQYVYAFAGDAGDRQGFSDGYGTKGGAGKNDSPLSMLNGGTGAEITPSSWLDWSDNIAKSMSKEPAGGGGGAASAVYACDGKGNFNKTNDLLMIASGGGAGASWNEAYVNGLKVLGVKVSTSVKSSAGANGNGNFVNNGIVFDNNKDLKGPVTISNGNFLVPPSPTIIYGLNGGGASNTSGKAGTDSAGAAGTVAAAAWNVMGAGSASPGTDYANGGNGGASFYYGGGGGGGYCGGGGGAGTSLEVTAGGGGSGSSYISYKIYQDAGVSYAGIITEVSQAETCCTKTADGIIPQGTSESAGYIIIKYLGPDDGNFEVPQNTTKSLSTVLNEMVEIGKGLANNKSVKNTNTNDAIYSNLMSNQCANFLLSGRAWQVSKDGSGNVTVYFTDAKSTSYNNKAKVWRYQNGTLSYGTGTVYNSYIYTMPSKWTAGTFDLT